MDYLMGDIVCFAFNFAPYGWLKCSGQTLNISDYSSLYTLLGTKFGGNGATTFCLPDLSNASKFYGAMSYYICTNGIYPSRS
jgi:microcystin-dependent protein